MQYAVIRSGGKQYKVTKGEVLEVDKIAEESEKPFVFDDVLLVVDEGNVSIGKPALDNVTVKAKLIEQKKGDKIYVMKYKAKSRYRRRTGFRSHLSVIQIESIEVGSKKPEKTTKTIKSAPKEPKK